MRSRSILLITAFLLAGAAPLVAQTGVHAVPAGKAAFGAWGVDLDARDAAVRPGQDFWRYANGAWFRANPIPADRTSWGVSSVLSEEVERQLRQIVEHGSDDAIGRQVGDFYASWMDEAGIEARGAAATRPYLDRIAAVQDRAALINLLFARVCLADRARHHRPANPTAISSTLRRPAGHAQPRYYLREGPSSTPIAPPTEITGGAATSPASPSQGQGRPHHHRRRIAGRTGRRAQPRHPADLQSDGSRT